jgi:threonyl-tRNA synthetase
MSDKFLNFKDDLPDYVRNDQDFELYCMRHSSEHVLTQAMIDLYGKDKVIMAMGPATAEGFYFDFELKDSEISEDDFERIEKRMQEIKEEKQAITRKEVSLEDAKEMFKDNKYKMEWLEQINEAGEKVTVYEYSNKFVDLCKGPHVDDTSQIGYFKLLKMAGAYWHGDEKNIMLKRIYGTSFRTKEELENYLHMLEEAKKRDHKKLAKELDLLIFSPLIGSGFPVYTPRGTVLRSQVYNFSRELNESIGYEEVATPNVNRAELFKVSGHYDKYKNDMLRVVSQYSDEELYFKPMNCPQHTQIFAGRQRSYKDLPIRIADFSNLARDEKPGELNGILRSRIFTQDDGHCFCREDQIKEEFKNVAKVIKKALAVYGLDYKIRLSFWDPNNKAKYLGEASVWERSQKTLKELADEEGYDYYLAEGEAAIYGPKMDFMAVDSLGREWQISTIQIDMIMPVRFDLKYTDVDGSLKTPVMIHRAIVGSERFIAIIIEHYNGAFPLWLAPEQIRIIPISEQNNEYARKIMETLRENKFRCSIDEDADRMQNKIRKAQEMKVPLMIIIGSKEQENNVVSLRYRSGEELRNLDISDIVTSLNKNISKRDSNIKLDINA